MGEGNGERGLCYIYYNVEGRRFFSLYFFLLLLIGPYLPFSYIASLLLSPLLFSPLSSPPPFSCSQIFGEKIVLCDNPPAIAPRRPSPL